MKQHNLNNNDFELDEIVSIELIGELPTVDITVKDVHLFFANDVYSHNSGVDSDIVEADKIADSYAKVMHADFIMGWSRRTNDKVNNTARCHVMKNRFGPDGVTLPCKMDTNTGTIEVYEPNLNSNNSSGDSGNSGLQTKQLLHKKYVDNMG